MFWMNMGPHGCRRMHHGGYRPMGGLFMFPGILFGGFFGIYVILAVLNIAGTVIEAVFSGLAAVFSGMMDGIGSSFSGLGTSGSLILGIIIGIALFRGFRNSRTEESAEEE